MLWVHTGGASQALGYLVSVPGASNTVLDAQVPYSRESFLELLPGNEPAQYVSTYPVFHVISHSLFGPMSYHTGVK